MKKRLLSLLAVVLCMAGSMKALNQVGGVYQIATAQDLLDFATLVNGGTNTVNAVLTADIDLTGKTWTPIGNSTYKYTGTFDGQGHAITGFSLNTSAQYSGLFGVINAATVKNFSISGTLTTTGNENGVVGWAEGASLVSGIHSSLDITVNNVSSHTGGIVGGSEARNESPLLVENCEYSGTLTHTGSTGDCQAGILGYTYVGGVRSCIFSGTIIGTSSKYGGIIGYCKRPNFLGVQNCLSVGKIVANSGNSTAAAIIANWNSENDVVTQNVKNNYYCLALGSTTSIAIGNKASMVSEAPVAVNAEQLASGEICYKLGAAFRQTIGTDAHPMLDADSKPVFLNGTYQNPASTISFDENVTFNAYSDFNVDEVTMARTLAAGKWDAFCVPFSMTTAEIASQLGSGAEVKELTSVVANGTDYALMFSTASSIEAGKPYMVKVPGDVSSISLGSKTIKAALTPTTADEFTFNGTYANDFAPTGSFIIKDNESQRVTGSVALKGFRGYITADEGMSVRMMSFGLDGIENGIEPGPAIADSLTFSVIGNSISTYYDYIPSGYAIYYNSDREKNNNVQVGDQWWMQLSRMSGLSFLANASWSGSRVAFDSDNGAIAPFCSNARVVALGRAGNPNFIFIAGGTNDWAQGSAALGEYNTTGVYNDSLTFRGAYSLLLHKLTTRYPKARIVCLSILPRGDANTKANNTGWTQNDGNESIRHIAEQFGQYYIDCSDLPFSSNWSKYMISGNLHPTGDGFTLMAERITEQLIAQGLITADLKRSTEVDEAERLLDICFTADGIVNNGTYNATVGKHGSATTSYDAVNGKYIGSSNATSSDYFYATYDEGSPLAEAFNGSVTWEMLVRLDAQADQDGNTNKTCFLGSEQDGGWCFYNNASLASTFSYTHKSGVKSSVKNFTGDWSLVPGKFYHLVVTMDRMSHIIRYYVNGELVRTGTRAGSDMLLPQCGTVKGHEGMWICLGGDVTSGDYNNGAENSAACSFVFARIYNGALSEEATLSLYNEEVKEYADAESYFFGIDTPDKLVEFASLVNSGMTTLNAKLTADIDMTGKAWPAPIGCWTPKVNDANVMYKGHFDGQGHTISNLTYTTAQNYHGLFGVVSTGALIENFSVSGSVANALYSEFGTVGFARDNNPTIRNVHSSLNFTNTKVGARIGGIVGNAYNGTTNIERCTYSGTIEANDAENNGNYGGMVGIGYNSTSAICNITDCLFNGKLKNTASSPGNCTFGGMVGYSNSAVITIKNCVSIGTVQSKVYGQFWGAVKNASSAIVNSYYKGSVVNGSSSTVTPGTQEATTATDAQLASGEICYKLNGSTQGGESWRETLGTDAYPVPSDASKKVYYVGSTYINFNTDAEGRMLISTPQELQNFAAIVNSGGRTLDAVLVNDIDMTGKGWPQAIGNWNTGNVNSAYKGHFNGQGHTVSNLTYTTVKNWHGLFGVLTEGAIVENFTVTGSVTNASYNCIGTIGFTRDGNVTVRGIRSFLNINNTKNGQNVGGIVAQADNGTTFIDRCTYSGTLDGKDTGTDGKYGGIVGYVNNNTAAIPTLTNCLFDGELKNTADSPGQSAFGGMVGFKNQGTVTIKDCLSIGTLPEKTSGQLFGKVVGGPTTICDNFYYKDGNVGGLVLTNPITGTPVEVADAQLKSGEVACKLGEAWHQLLNTDTYPAPDDTKPNVYMFEVTDAGYASLVPEANVLALPEGVTAYAGQKVDNWLHLEKVTEIPADNAVILKAAAGTYYYNDTDAERTLGVANDLTFSEIDITADGSQYILVKPDEGVVGFYRAKAGSTIAARKAYLVNANNVRGFLFEEDDATSINEELRKKKQGSTAEGKVNEGFAPIYNLAGQRVNNTIHNSQLKHGIYIVNGKKLLK